MSEKNFFGKERNFRMEIICDETHANSHVILFDNLGDKRLQNIMNNAELFLSNMKVKKKITFSKCNSFNNAFIYALITIGNGHMVQESLNCHVFSNIIFA